MQNVELLLAALEYMEMHLGQDIKTEDVAKACYCSKCVDISQLYDLFVELHEALQEIKKG